MWHLHVTWIFFILILGICKMPAMTCNEKGGGNTKHGPALTAILVHCELPPTNPNNSPPGGWEK